MCKLLIDTNILVYGIDQDSKFLQRSRNILDGSDHQLVTTSKNLLEFLATAVVRPRQGSEWLQVYCMVVFWMWLINSARLRTKWFRRRIKSRVARISGGYT